MRVSIPAVALLFALLVGCGARSSISDLALTVSRSGDAGARDATHGVDGAPADARLRSDAPPADVRAKGDAPIPTDVSQPADARLFVDGAATDGALPDASTPPDGATCSGCWRGSTCIALPSTTVEACGFGGTACMQCPGMNPTCFKGACSYSEPGCGPANCKGCCLDHNTCSPGIYGDSCGSAGGQCQGCANVGNGSCMPLADGGGGSCQPTCGPGACRGCCEGSQCLLGQSSNACGAAGGACTPCPDGELCKEVNAIAGGACMPACAPSNCVGCCANDVCAVGTQDIACGTGGLACTDCTATFEECGGGTCMP
jgi:hypothetical protein